MIIKDLPNVQRCISYLQLKQRKGQRNSAVNIITNYSSYLHTLHNYRRTLI